MCGHLLINKRKDFFTYIMFLSSFILGWLEHMFGACLLDIKERTHVSFSTSADYVIALDIGELAGAVVLIIPYNHLNPFLVMAAFTGLMSVSIAIVPWITEYTVMFMVCIAIGTSVGLLRPLQTSEVSAVWGKECSKSLLILYTVRKLGTMVSLLFISAFMSPISEESLQENKRNLSGELEPTTSEDLYIPFTVAAVLSSIVTILFVAVYAWFRKNQLSDLYSLQEYETTTEIRLLHKIASYILIIAISGVMTAFNFGTNRFISSYIVKQFHSSRRDAACVNALFNGAGLLGRLIAIFVMQYVSKFTLVCCNSFILVIGTVSLYLCSTYGSSLALVCVCVSMMAVGTYPNGSLLPVVIAESFFPVTRTVASVISFAGIGTDMLESWLKGYIIGDVGAIHFNVIMIVESVLCFIFFALLFGLKRKIHVDKKPMTNEKFLK